MASDMTSCTFNLQPPAGQRCAQPATTWFVGTDTWDRRARPFLVCRCDTHSGLEDNSGWVYGLVYKPLTRDEAEVWVVMQS